MKEFASNYNAILCLDADIATDTTTAGGIMDTQGSNGLTFIMGLPTYGSAGSFTLLIEEGDESDLSDATTVTNLVFDAPVASGIDADGASLARQGAYQTKRYVRASVVSASTSGTTHAFVICLTDMALKPVDQA